MGRGDDVLDVELHGVRVPRDGGVLIRSTLFVARR